MIGLGILYRDVFVLVQDVLLGIGVLVMLLGEALAARKLRLRLRRRQRFHQLCRSHG